MLFSVMVEGIKEMKDAKIYLDLVTSDLTFTYTGKATNISIPLEGVLRCFPVC
jgi:hypothetical protein